MDKSEINLKIKVDTSQLRKAIKMIREIEHPFYWNWKLVLMILWGILSFGIVATIVLQIISMCNG